MNLNLSSLDFSVKEIQTKVSTKEISSNNSKDFDKILEKTQNNPRQDKLQQSKDDIKEVKKINSSSTYSNKNIKNNKTEEDFKLANMDKDIPSEEDIINLIEEKTGLSRDETKEILEEMGITAYDLFSSNNLQQFIQKVYQIEEPVDLLTTPNVNKTYKDILETLNTLEEKFPNIKNSIIDIEGNNEKIIEVSKNEYKDVFVNDSTSQEYKSLLKDNSGNNSNSQKDTIKEENPINQNSSIIEVEVEKNVISNNGMEIIQESIITENRTIGTQLHQVKEVIHREPIIEQMVDHIKVNLKDDLAEMNLKLKPDYLGNLSLKIITEKGIVTAQFMVENQAVKETIETNFNQLRETLEEQGVKVENLEVFVKQEFNNQESNLKQRNSTKSHKRIASIISNIEDTTELYDDKEILSPYINSESEIDFSA